MAKINTEFSFTDNVTPGLRRMQGAISSVSQGFNDMAMKLMGVNSAMQIISTVRYKFMQLSGEIMQCTAAYQYQSEQELKLETIMKKRMNATQGDIQVIKDLAAAQQRLGIYADEMILQGAQELASFTSNRKAIELLVPAMNNLIAQQYGYNATGMDFQHTADMMGKVLSGQVGALSRIGYIFSEDEKKMLKTGNEMQRAATLAKIITDNVGEMNQAMAGTDVGKMQNVNKTVGDLKEQIGRLIMPFMSLYRQITGQWNIKFHQNIIKALQYITNHMDIVVNHINDVVIVLGVLGAAFMTVAAKAATSAAISAASWAIANAPITIMISLIGALIAGISALLIYSDKTFTAIGGFLEGIDRLIDELGQNIIHYLGKAIEFTYNGFLKLFDFIWAGCERVASVMDRLVGTSMADNIQEMRNLMKGQTAELNWYNDRAGFKNAWEAGKQDAYGGKALSDRFQSSINKLTSKLTDGLRGIKSNVSAGIQDALKTDGGILSVADKNLVNIADDYHELLSARAAERFNLQYSSMTPELNISNINVNNGADEDSLISKLVNMLDEAAKADLRRG